MPEARQEPATVPVRGERWPVVKFRVPPGWVGDLHSAAASNGLSVAAYLRLILRGALRDRYSEAEREALR